MHLIDSSSAVEFFLKQLTEDLRNAPSEENFITVDTEFIRENLDTPLLCIVQISSHKNVFIIDPIAIKINFLKNIFENPKIQKVFHSARQDLEILMNYGIGIENFFDTQLYEMILDTKINPSYQTLVLKYVGKKLKKYYSLSNWTKRPLNQQQLIYCEEDVLYLREVYKKQTQKLIELKRTDWMDDELEQLKNLSQSQEEEKLFENENQFEIFQKITEWREKKSTENNINLESIATNELIISICKKGYDYVCKLKNSRSPKSKYQKEFLFFAEKLMANYVTEEKFQPKNTAVTNLLKVILELCSDENQIAPPILATTSELDDLANGKTSVRCLSGWRRNIFGQKAIDLLDGRLIIGIKNSKPILNFLENSNEKYSSDNCKPGFLFDCDSL